MYKPVVELYKEARKLIACFNEALDTYEPQHLKLVSLYDIDIYMLQDNDRSIHWKQLTSDVVKKFLIIIDYSLIQRYSKSFISNHNAHIFGELLQSIAKVVPFISTEYESIGQPIEIILQSLHEFQSLNESVLHTGSSIHM